MSQPTDQELDQSVATMLRIGVSLSAVMVISGAALLFRHPLQPAPDYRTFEEGNPALHSIAGIVQGTIDLAPKSVIQFGLLLLIATPIARVVLCVVGFARQKSALYVGISTLVLTVLLLSLFQA